MNIARTFLLIALSNQGHWFGGHPGVIEIRWPVEHEMPAAVLHWQLELSGARLADGSVGLRDQASRIEVVPPVVRTRTALRWAYRLVRESDQALLSEGAETIHVYPAGLLAGSAARIEGKRIVVCDVPEGLPRVLAEARIPHQALRDPHKLRLAKADIVLVGSDRLTRSPFAQTALLNLAESGASVLLFEQTRVKRLAGFALARRAASPELTWRREHPLLIGFEPGDFRWDSLGGPLEMRAIQLPADEPALEIAFWPPATPATEPTPIDAVLVVKAVGTGRLVLCQLPLRNWHSDPRSRILLRNALEYLATRPEPTPPSSRRRQPVQRRVSETPRITIPSGVDP